MKLKDVMTREPIVLTYDLSVQEAVAVFIEHEIDGAPVVDEEGRVRGLFTKTHVFRMVAQGMDMSTPVKTLMTREVITGYPDDELGHDMSPRVGRLPVVDETGIVVGMMTRSDLARFFYNRYWDISSKLDTIIDSTYNLIVSVNEQGRIEVFNKSAEKFLGYKAEEARGQHIMDLFPTSGLMDIVETGKVEPLQKVKLNGHYFISNRSPIVKEGKTIGAVAVMQDISELEKASKELEYVKELNKELHAIIESSFDGLFIADGRGITLRVNEAFERITGIPRQSMLGRDVMDVEEEGLVSESVSALVLQNQETVTIIQQTKNGKIALVTGSPVFGEDGSVFRIVCNVRDITELNRLKQDLEQALSLREHYESELQTLRLQYAGTGKMVVNSSKMRELMAMVIRVARVDSTVLITGESGTGKELVAETIHNYSDRKRQPFIKVNCGAIPENLLESELFGYEPGAFTGASQEGKPGYFELAQGGTLFLDEIGDLPLNLQVKLLRVLQAREIVRVGGTKPLKIDVRIVAGTHRNLREMVNKREFREDLYYRLNVIPINVPPLRERKEEITSLVMHFIRMFNRKYNLNKKISPEVIDVFMQYDWPGNVRELENLVERMVVITPEDVITREDLPIQLIDQQCSLSEVSVSGIIPLREAVESVEKQILEQAYTEYRTTRQMARALKVDASTVVRKAAKYGISQSKSVQGASR